MARRSGIIGVIGGTTLRLDWSGAKKYEKQNDEGNKRCRAGEV